MTSRLKSDPNKGKQVYLSGPMRGYQNFNFQAFLAGAEKLRRLGYKVYDPAEHELAAGFDPETGKYKDGHTVSIRELIVDDLTWICQFADLVVVLPGWQKSKGALAEVHCAYAIGVPVREIGDFDD
jgi:hypothetical protein